MHMNYSERRNIFYRLISVGLISISLALDVYAFIKVLEFNAEDKILTIVALSLAMAFTVLEIVVILKGWKKDSNLFKIAFNESDRVNNVPLVAVIAGTVFGLGLTILSVVIYLIKEEVDTKNAMIIIMAIAVYLLVNCIVYYLFLLIFKRRNLNIKDLIR